MRERAKNGRSGRARMVRSFAVLAALVVTALSPGRSRAGLLPLPGGLVVTITEPAAGAGVSGTTRVSASVSPLGVMVAGVQFKLDGADLGAEDRSAPYSIAWDTTRASNGWHTLTAVARDALGLRFTSDPVRVTVFNVPPDTTPPNVAITSPASGATVSGSIVVTAGASDDVGVTGVRFELDGDDLGQEDTAPPYAVSWDTTASADGAHTLAAIARDAAGNVAASAPVTVTVDNGAPPPAGDLFVSLRDGKVRWFAPDGTLKKEMTSLSDGAANGMALDAAGNLYVTEWFGTGGAGNTVARYDTGGNLVGSFGTGYNFNPESIVFDAAGNAYVGQADGTADVLKLSAAGDLLASYDVTIQHRGSDWVEMSADQCTLLYTSRELDVLRYDACANTQLSHFNTEPLPGPAFALKELPGGGVLVATLGQITRLDAGGRVVQSYDALGEPDLWIGLDLAGDGTFWASNLGSSNVVRFDIATGAVVGSFNTGTPGQTVDAVVVKR